MRLFSKLLTRALQLLSEIMEMPLNDLNRYLEIMVVHTSESPLETVEFDNDCLAVA